MVPEHLVGHPGGILQGTTQVNYLTPTEPSRERISQAGSTMGPGPWANPQQCAVATSWLWPGENMMSPWGGRAPPPMAPPIQGSLLGLVLLGKFGDSLVLLANLLIV